MMKCPIKFCQRQVEIRRDRDGGYRVALLVRPPMEDMFETLVHVVLFKFEPDATRFSLLVKKADELDLDQWTWGKTQASPWGFMQRNSEAVIQNEAIVSKAYQTVLDAQQQRD